MADRKAFDAIFGKQQSALTPDPLARPDSPTARFLAERYAVGDAPTASGYYGDYRTDPENKVEERGIILPGAKYSDGKIHPAWPAIVHDAWQGMKAFETADPTDNSPEATARLSKAAFDAAGLAMTGSLAVPRPTNAVGTFGGKLAKTADHAKLAEAEKMAAAGAPREAIWDKTGWMQGPDGKWKFEISDHNAKVNEYPFTPKEAYEELRQTYAVNPHDFYETRLKAIAPLQDLSRDEILAQWKAVGTRGLEAAHAGDYEKAKAIFAEREPQQFMLDAMSERKYGPMSAYLDHPDLYAAYPETANLHTRIAGDELGPRTRGTYFPGDRTQGEQINLRELASYSKEDKGVLLHEGQHKTQTDEGFARGSSPREFSLNPNNIKEIILTGGINGTPLPAGSPFESLLVNAARLDVPGFHGNSMPELRDFIAAQQSAGKLSVSTPEIADKMARNAAWNMYRRSAGEAEARLVQKRMDLTPEQRQARPPWLDYDVPESDQIVRFGNSGPQQSAGDFLKERYGSSTSTALGGDGAITLPPMRDAPIDPAQYIKTSDYDKALNAPYSGGASSRQVPFSGPLPPVGSWRMADRTGLYGRDIEHLRQVDPNDLLLPEIREGKLDPTKRGDDVRYADWMREGKKPPPIEVLQMDDGRFRVMDGHRRALAAQQAGQPIEAWVSYSVPTGKVDANGNPMKTSLTYELAHPTVDRTAASTPATGSLNQTTSPQDFLKERYGGESSEPLRGYHGASMPYEGDAYNPRKSQYKAFFGAERPELANNFARSYGDNPRVYPVEVSPSANMFNPANPEHNAKIVAAFDKNPGMLSGFLMGKDTLRRMLAEGDGGLMESAGVQQWLRKNKFDGWRFQDTAAPPSADDKRGAFGMLKPGFVRSSTTGDLLYSNPKESAALPSAVKALENRALPMDKQSQLARAREMEFDTKRTWYHATDQDFDAFDVNAPVSNKDHDNGVGVFLAKRNGEANWFVQKPTDLMGSRSNEFVDYASIIPVHTRIKNPAVFDTQADFRAALDDAPYDRRGGGYALRTMLEQQGHDGIIILDSQMDNSGGGQWQIVFDPKNIRSVNAAFDPAQSHSANLLAANPKSSAAVPVGVKAVEGQQMKAYPLAPRSEWYGEANFETTGGKMRMMSPDEFLKNARPLEIDDVSRENIDLLKAHMQEGRTLDPLQLYPGGKEDGRHRAYAAKELGITSVPVIVFDTAKQALGRAVKN